MCPSSQDRVAVGAQPPALAQIADQVPVHDRLVRAAGLRIRLAEREVDGAADLLVEQDRADRAVDPEVGADPELAEDAGAVVGVERRLQVGVAALGARGHHAALAELERHVLDHHAARRRRDREADPALGRVLVRAGEDLAGRHVALAVGVDPRAALDVRASGPCPAPRSGSRAPARAARSASPGSRAARPRPRPGRRGPGTARARRTPRSPPCPSPPAGRRPRSATA